MSIFGIESKRGSPASLLVEGQFEGFVGVTFMRRPEGCPRRGFGELHVISMCPLRSSSEIARETLNGDTCIWSANFEFVRSATAS